MHENFHGTFIRYYLCNDTVFYDTVYMCNDICAMILSKRISRIFGRDVIGDFV